MLATLINNSCKKLDSITKTASPEEIEAKFFAAKPGTPAIVHKVIDALKKQNNLGHFVASLAKKDGYAIWEKSQVSIYNKTLSRNGENETQETLVFTPIVQQDSNFVNGFFFSRIIGDSVELHLYRANDYDLFPKGKVDSSVVTAELITMKLLELNDEVFVHRKYELIDSSVFKKSIGFSFRTIELDTTVRQNGNTTGRSAPYQCGYVCYYVITSECISPINICSFCLVLSCLSECATTPTHNIPPLGNGGYNWPPDPPIIMGGGGGGGGSSTGNCIPGNCRNGSTLIIEGRIPCGGCGGGPVIVIPPDEPPIYTQHQLDLQWMQLNMIDTSNDPCVLNALSTLKSLDTTVPQLIRNFFDTIPAFKMFIGTESNNIWSPNQNSTSYTAPRGGSTLPNTINDSFNVRINKYYNRQTDLGIAATILHEAFHCQLMYWFRHMRLMNDTAKANQVARDFGWVFTREITGFDSSYHQIIQLNPPEIHHHVMADLFIDLMASALKNFGEKKGINASNNFYEKLAWIGLTDSKAFNNLSYTEQTEILNVINAEKDPTAQILNPFTGIPLNSDNYNPKGHPCP